jgi:RNase adaptor protein for sRNA GlmZ degradation
MTQQLAHATCVALEGRAVLLRGPSGSGKSDLALRLIAEGARLIADDQTVLTLRDGRILASAPASIAGKLEVRGLGIQRVPSLGEAPLALIVDLVGPGAVERLPEGQSEELLGVLLPRFALDPFTASAPAKLRLALKGLEAETAPQEARAAKLAGAPLVVLVTGLSGAGHSTALRFLEDRGFEAIDNLPMRLLKRILKDNDFERPLAIGMDTRTRGFATQNFLETLDGLLGREDLDIRLVFLDCEDEVLERRFTETRRRHPLATDRPLADGIAAERHLLSPLRERASFQVDTSRLHTSELGRLLAGELGLGGAGGLSLFVTSFSYRKGLPREADLVFDVRFLRNPHYEAALRPLTGLDAEVSRYVEGDTGFRDFFDRLTALLAPLLPRYEAEGKSYLTLTIGCTGGRHRSVAIAERLAQWLLTQGRSVTVGHRDLPGGEGEARSLGPPAKRA